MNIIKKLLKTSLNRSGYTVFRCAGDDVEGYFESTYKKQFTSDELIKKTLFNIGAGSFSHKYWTNIDKKSEWYRDKLSEDFVDHDLLTNESFKISSNCASIVYTSHVFEHIFDSNLEFYISEIHRIIVPGGVVRIACPDSTMAINAYRSDNVNFFKQWNMSIDNVFEGLLRFVSSQVLAFEQNELNKLRCRFDELLERSDALALDYLCSFSDKKVQMKSPFNHVNWLSYSKLFSLMDSVGFVDVKKSSFGQSESDVLRDVRYFDNTYPYMSLYMEARKNK